MNNNYSICYNEWIFDKNIKNELGLLLIISGFCMNDRECFATNEYFANLFKIDEATVSRKLKKLQKKGYISIKYKRKGCQVISRVIRLTKKSTAVDKKINRTIDKKVKDTNTSNITITNITNMYSRVALDDTQLFSEIIACFNKVGIVENFKTKKEFHYKNTKNNQKLIKKLLEQGYTKDDIMDVIFMKYDQWVENNNNNNSIDMMTYYRPSTVLGEKFDEYYAEAKAREIS